MSKKIEILLNILISFTVVEFLGSEFNNLFQSFKISATISDDIWHAILIHGAISFCIVVVATIIKKLFIKKSKNKENSQSN